MPENTTITWLGHATWRIVTPGGVTVLVDPWLASNPRCPEDEHEASADVVLVTHGHGDHIADAVAVAQRGDATTIAQYEIAGWLGEQGAPNAIGMNTGGTVEARGLKVTMTQAFHSSSISPADGAWARHVLQGWFEMMDLSKPLIAQVHGYCLAGGTELATACDLVYVADDAQIGYPPVRSMSSPDMAWHVWLMGMRRAMEAMLTGDSMSGAEAVTAGFANRSFPADRLDDEVLAIAQRVARVEPDLQAINKRVVHRAMEAMGMRDGMKATADLNALGFHQRSSKAYFEQLRKGVTQALDQRDKQFGDYRTTERGTQ